MGLWKMLRVHPWKEQSWVDAEAVLEAVQATNCIVDATGLEQATQVYLQVFESAGMKVLIAYIRPTGTCSCKT